MTCKLQHKHSNTLAAATAAAACLRHARPDGAAKHAAEVADTAPGRGCCYSSNLQHSTAASAPKRAAATSCSTAAVARPLRFPLPTAFQHPLASHARGARYDGGRSTNTAAGGIIAAACFGMFKHSFSTSGKPRCRWSHPHAVVGVVRVACCQEVELGVVGLRGHDAALKLHAWRRQQQQQQGEKRKIAVTSSSSTRSRSAACVLAGRCLAWCTATFGGKGCVCITCWCVLQPAASRRGDAAASCALPRGDCRKQWLRVTLPAAAAAAVDAEQNSTAFDDASAAHAADEWHSMLQSSVTLPLGKRFDGNHLLHHCWVEMQQLCFYICCMLYYVLQKALLHCATTVAQLPCPRCSLLDAGNVLKLPMTLLRCCCCHLK